MFDNILEHHNLVRIITEIRERIGLDFFGIDLGYISDSEFVFFESNAAMTILPPSNMPEYRNIDYKKNLRLIETDVIEVMQERGIIM